jgi:hypothetical protein
MTKNEIPIGLVDGAGARFEKDTLPPPISA